VFARVHFRGIFFSHLVCPLGSWVHAE